MLYSFNTVPKLIILDRDGVINQDLPRGCASIEDFVLLPHVCQAIAMINSHGLPVVLATNQALVGRGELSLEGLEAIHRHVQAELKRHGAWLDKIYYCTDTEIAPHYRRKPAPGMLLEAMHAYHALPQDTVFIGDGLTDLQAAEAAGCHGVLVRTGKGEKTLQTLHDQGLREKPVVFQDLYQAIQALLASAPWKGSSL